MVAIILGDSKQSRRRLVSRKIAMLAMIIGWSSIPVQSEYDKDRPGPDWVINVDLTSPDEVAMRSMLDQAAPWPVLSPETGRLLQRLGSQTIDQSLHVVMGAAPVWASRHLIGVPWYGWLIAPVLVYREWRQWPSNRWWDPPLDWTFLSLGVVAATWGPAPWRVRRRCCGALPRLELH